ncbi:MAG: flagellar hook assembly protein FlgD [Proteobacteria bacterium]|nr:flagellar hook assembly protein FlgD [Pseudomonadota bacterium]MBU1057308.1 flagellar hook assembly protein FlgD [Pseudomonadota bacterium]
MTTISESILDLSTATVTTSTSSIANNEEVMGKEDFLTLLVAQLQNQDPLNPDDATEFTAQLAQFSSLEQLVNLNESVDALATSQQASDQLSAMGLLGKDVVFQESSFEFNGEPVTLGYQLDEAASAVTMTVYNENGVIVSTVSLSELEAGNHFVEWDGVDSNGDVLADGQYEISLQASAGEDESVGVLALVQSEVSGVELGTGTGNTNLVTLAGTISLSSILAVSEQVAPSVSTVEATDEESEDASETENETAVSPDTTESTLTPDEQIVLDSLQYYLMT